MLAKVNQDKLENTHFAMSAPEDHGEGAGANEVLGIVLVIADDLHLSRVSDLYRRAEVDGLSTTRGCIARDRRSICGVAVVVPSKKRLDVVGIRSTLA